MMITPKRRRTLYTKTFRFMLENKVKSVPLDLNNLCNSCGVELIPLSQITKETGLTKAEVFAIWGNQDGAVNAYNGIHRIAYNDCCCTGRTRFTICEELGHIICDHTNDPEFNIFAQAYSNEKYSCYDEEARLVAGFLVCHPKFFYTYEKMLSPQLLSTICEITLPCASARYDILQKYRKEVESTIAYRSLPIPKVLGGMRKYEKIYRFNSTNETINVRRTH